MSKQEAPQLVDTPLLFVKYLNNFENCLIDSKACLYTDDTHINVVSTNVEDLIQNARMELTNISTWMRINEVSANPPPPTKGRIPDT